MTHRPVEDRVKEINSATGVLFPYSVRAAFPVKDAKVAEKAVFESLEDFRVRADREFFEIDFGEAARIVRQVLHEGGMIERPKGKISWFDKKKGYGLINTSNGVDVFLHHSRISRANTEFLSEGTTVEFDLEVTERGLAALNVKLLPEQFALQEEDEVPATALLSEAALADDWLSPEEEEAWAHLKDLPSL